MRLIASSDIIGHLSRWAVQQHPYHAPDGLFEFVQVTLSKCGEDFKDGVPILPMRWFASSQELYRWLKRSFDGHATLTVWNTPRPGHTRQHIFSSRYDGPAPEDDIIDIDALWMNVARGVWDDAKESDKPSAPAEQDMVR